MTETAEIFVSKDMTISEAIDKYPTAAEIMNSYGLQCFGCSVNTMESIENGAKGHGFSDQQVEDMVNEINTVLAKQGPVEKKDVQEEVVDPNLTITQLAADKLKAFMKQQGKPDHALRVAVVRGGCSGYVYHMEFAKVPVDDDIKVEQKGVRLFIDRNSTKMLAGTTLDYVESLQGAGFKFQNPNEKASCGCGKSFK